MSSSATSQFLRGFWKISSNVTITTREFLHLPQSNAELPLGPKRNVSFTLLEYRL
jgi:hypothetical protein